MTPHYSQPDSYAAARAAAAPFEGQGDDGEPEGWTLCDTGDCAFAKGHDGDCSFPAHFDCEPQDCTQFDLANCPKQPHDIKEKS